MGTIDEDLDSESLIIRVMTGVHCARGPKNCEKCFKLSKKKRISLVHFYGDDGTVARPVIEVMRDEVRQWFVYDIVREFDTKEQTMAYAKAHSISDIDLSGLEK